MQYSQQLEKALALLREKYIELEKDHEILNKSYLRQLKQMEGMHKAMNRVKLLVQHLSILDGKMCTSCRNANEFQEIKQISQGRLFEDLNSTFDPQSETTID